MDLWKPVALALIGLGGIGYGLNFDPAHPKCGPVEIHPGQVCQSDARGTALHRSYDEVVRDTNNNRLAYPSGGGALIVAAGVWAYWSNRRPKTAAEAATPVVNKPAGRLRGGPEPTGRSVMPSPSAAPPTRLSADDLDMTMPRFGTVNHPGQRPLPSHEPAHPSTCSQQTGQVVSGTQIFPRAAFDPEATLAPGILPTAPLTAAQAEETLPPGWTPKPRVQPSAPSQWTSQPHPQTQSAHQGQPAQTQGVPQQQSPLGAQRFPQPTAPQTSPQPGVQQPQWQPVSTNRPPQQPVQGQAQQSQPYRPRAPRPEGYPPKR